MFIFKFQCSNLEAPAFIPGQMWPGEGPARNSATVKSQHFE